MPCFAIAETSRIETLRRETVERAERSFSFFVRAVLGQRRRCPERLERLARGEVVPSSIEARLLERWRQVQQGLTPPELAWARSPRAA